MQKNVIPSFLFVLRFESYLVLALFVILPIVMTFEGKEVDVWQGLSLIFIGLIGTFTYEITLRLYRRVIALEKVIANQKSVADSKS